MERGAVVLTDLLGAHEIYAQGHRAERMALHPSDWISIGRHILTLKVGWR